MDIEWFKVLNCSPKPQLWMVVILQFCSNLPNHITTAIDVASIAIIRNCGKCVKTAIAIVTEI